jgi:hypothetical protein
MFFHFSNIARDTAEGYSDTGRAQWDVSQWDVSTRGATEFIFPVSGGCDISSGNGQKSHVDMGYSHVNMAFFSQHEILKKTHVNF